MSAHSRRDDLPAGRNPWDGKPLAKARCYCGWIGPAASSESMRRRDWWDHADGWPPKAWCHDCRKRVRIVGDEHAEETTDGRTVTVTDLVCGHEVVVEG